MDSLVEMFCDVDDFCQEFQPYWEQKLLTAGIKQRRRSGQLCLSEIMTIIVHFHPSSYRNFKAYYPGRVDKQRQHKGLSSAKAGLILLSEKAIRTAGRWSPSHRCFA